MASEKHDISRFIIKNGDYSSFTVSGINKDSTDEGIVQLTNALIKILPVQDPEKVYVERVEETVISNN